jgi:hypothetical protein
LIPNTTECQQIFKEKSDSKNTKDCGHSFPYLLKIAFVIAVVAFAVIVFISFLIIKQIKGKTSTAAVRNTYSRLLKIKLELKFV